VNRATSETLRQQATQEGLVPLKAWVKSALDHVIQECMNEPGLEFVWVGDDAVDPLEQAQTLNILVSAGIKTREEARADLGLGAAGGALGKPQAGLGKYNSNHDEQGRFSTADNAVATVGSPARKPRPTRVQVANSDDHATHAAIDGGMADAAPGSSDAPSVTGGPSPSDQYAFAGVLIDKRYDEVAGVTHCTYATPFETYTLEVLGHFTCPPTAPAPR
jgi:hypothetical protein